MLYTMRPVSTPLGLRLFQTSKAVRRAFDGALAEAGGSIPTWLVLTNLKASAWRSQHDLALAVGIEPPASASAPSKARRTALDVWKSRSPSGVVVGRTRTSYRQMLLI